MHREVVPQSEQLLTRHPLRERFCEQLLHVHPVGA
ncbi:BTAD domain-containing putative transcriptional regulator [Streptomyces microflavus]